MKAFIYVTTFIAVVFSMDAVAMSKKLRDINYESVSSERVLLSTQLRASDGSIISFREGSEAKISHLSIDADKKKGNYLYLEMVDGKKIPFKITGDTDYIRSSSDFSRLQILSLTSGQDHGIVFALDDIKRNDPVITNRTESCTIYRQETRCMRDEKSGERKCQTVDISTSGYQEVETTSVTTEYTISMTVRNNKGQSVITGTLYDSNTNTSRRESPCHY